MLGRREKAIESGTYNVTYYLALFDATQEATKAIECPIRRE